MIEEREYKFLKDINKILKRPLAKADNKNFINGFVVENNHIICLGIEHEKVEKLPDSFNALIYLKQLNLDHLGLKLIPESIGNFQELIEFSCEDNKLEYLPSSIGKLKRLIHLDISHNQIKTLPNTFGNLHLLNNLIISYNQINIEQAFDSLKQLFDQGCHFERNSAFFWLSATLQNLLVNSGKTQEELFDDLFKMDSLLSFHERCSKMHMVEEDLEKIWKPKGPELTEFEKHEIAIDGREEYVEEEYVEEEYDDYSWAMFYQDIPLVIDDYEVLIFLEQEFHQIIPVIEKAKMNFGFVAREGRIIELGLFSMNISEIYEAIVLLRGLKFLDLGKNNISFLPEWIVHMESLKNLNLEQNQLQVLPLEIGFLPNLEYLDISQNLLISIPKSLLNLKNLKYLNIHNNSINYDEIAEVLGEIRENGCEIETGNAFKFISN